MLATRIQPSDSTAWSLRQRPTTIRLPAYVQHPPEVEAKISRFIEELVQVIDRPKAPIEDPRLPAEAIVDAVLGAAGVTRADFFGETRMPEVCRCRRRCHVLLRAWGLSHARIAQLATRCGRHSLVSRNLRLWSGGNEYWDVMRLVERLGLPAWAKDRLHLGVWAIATAQGGWRVPDRRE